MIDTKIVREINQKVISVDFFDLDTSDFIQKFIIENEKFYEEDLLKYISSIVEPHATTFIDIGSNIGNHSLFFGKYLGSKIYAFEPYLINYNKSKKNLKLNSIDAVVENIGLGENNYEAFVSGDLEGGNLGGLFLSKSDDFKNNLKVNVTTIDDYFIGNAIPLREKIVVKIDTEGMEAKILSGSLNFLKRFSPILSVEICDLNSYKSIRRILFKDYFPLMNFYKIPTVIFMPRNKCDFNEITLEGFWHCLSHYVGSMKIISDLRLKLG